MRAFEPARLLLRAHLEPVFDEKDSRFDDRLLHLRRDFEKALHLVHRAEFHHPLDAGAIVPAAIKDDDLAAGRKMPHVSLDIHLRLFPLGRRGQRDDAEDARADALGDRLDDPALAGAVAALEHDADLETLGDDPELQLDQFGVQAGELSLVNFVAELFLRRRADPRPWSCGSCSDFLSQPSHSSRVRSLHHRRACLVKWLRAWT